jgi:acetoin utilization deacetylase AcuC-like enzyme
LPVFDIIMLESTANLKEGQMHVGMVYDPIFLKHDTGAHVEHAGRLKTIMDHLRLSELDSRLISISPRPATLEELNLIHQTQHIQLIQALALSGGGSIDSDTVVSAASYEAAIYAVGGSLEAVDAVIKGNVDCAFALPRPPGHHSTPNRSMGFCLFNNVAIAARYLLSTHGLSRIAIIDFDVHHGNGTQIAFNTDPRVLFASIHQYPFYPGTGHEEETGSAEAMGTKINVPLPLGCGDPEYLKVFEQIIVPAVDRFQPEFILVSAGYDAHWADDMSAMQVSTTGFNQMIAAIKQLAAVCCNNRLVLVLEGGYNLYALAASVVSTFKVLLGDVKVEDPLGPAPPGFHHPNITPLIEQIRAIHSLV